MRVNVDESALTDPRFRRLARYLEIPTLYETIGRCVPIWMTAYNRRSAILTSEDVDIAADRDGFAVAMVRAELAEQLDGDHVRLRGVADRIQFLLSQSTKARKRWDNRVDAAAHAGAGAPALPGLSVGISPGSAYGDAYSLDQDLTGSGSGSGSERSAGKARNARGHRTAPGSWQPRTEDALLPPHQREHELAKFRDHQFASAKTDWDATWRNWQRNALDRSRGQDTRGRTEPHVSSAYPEGRQEL